MKILMTGGNGQVAYDLNSVAGHRKELKIFSLTHDALDITDSEAVFSAIKKYQPNCVINTAAYTQVDRAEEEQEKAFAVNSDGAKNVAMACEKYRIPLLHLSTDYVFDGNQNHPYLETDNVSPINIYGESKLRGEAFIQRYCERFIILRVSAVFGVHNPNFVKTILRLARERDTLKVVADQITCPTPATAIAHALLKMCEISTSGIFHFCGMPSVSWYDFAKTIIRHAAQFEKLRVTQIEMISTCDYPTLAKRPFYSVLNSQKLFSTFGIKQPNWETGLIDVITHLYSA
jgi:dTDP-4-dehydrorhamnose reductase